VNAAIVIPPGGGEIIGDAPDRRVEILCEQSTVHATWSRFGPRRDGADLHIHRRHSDLFYVLDGELTVKLETGEVAARAGTLVTIPPLVVHGFRNASDADVRYLNLHTPGTGFADYMRGLRDGVKVPFDQEPPPPDGTRPPGDATFEATDEVAIPGAPPWRHDGFAVRPG
jgi:mannose-6-phosphate isomerase-like protein (cupin superfamily)